MRQPLRAWLVPVLVAAGVLLFGCVALLLFWLSSDYAGPRGLTYYPSATWGDGIFLPLAAFALVTLCSRLPPTPSRWPTVAATVLGSAVGGLVVRFWLTDPAPTVNWTLPEAHTFNAAGWYHAAFLIGACGLFAGLWIETLRRLRKLAGTPGTDAAARLNVVFLSPWLAVLVAGTVGYAILAVHDGARAGVTGAGLPSLVALSAATALLILLFSAALGRQLRGALLPIGVGCLAAIPLSFIFLDPPRSTVGYVTMFSAWLAGIALVATEGSEGGASPTRFRAPPLWIEALIVPSLLMASIAVLLEFVSRNMWIGLLIAGVLVVLPVFLRLLRMGRVGIAGRFAVSWGITVALLGACLCAAWLAEGGAEYYVTGGFVLTIVGAVLGGIFLPSYRADFERVMDLEADLAQRQAPPSRDQRLMVQRTWVRIGGYSAAAFGALLALTIALAPSLNWMAGAGSPPWKVWAPFLVLTLLTAAVNFPVFLQASLARPPASPTASVAREVVPYVALCVSVTVVTWVDLVRNWQMNWLAAVVSLLLTGFLANCIVGNGARLHLAPLRSAAWLCVGAGSVATLSLVYWSLTSAVIRGSTPLPLGSSLGMFLVSVVLAGAITAAGTALVYGLGGVTYKTPYPPKDGISQDVYLCGVLWLTLGWLPQLVWTHIAEGQERLAAVGSVMAGFLLLFGPAFLWVLENNDTHNGRQRAGRGLVVPPYATAEAGTYTRIRSLPRRVARHWFGRMQNGSDDEMHVEALDGHTATQNMLALVLAASTVIGSVGIASAATPDEL